MRARESGYILHSLSIGDKCYRWYAVHSPSDVVGGVLVVQSMRPCRTVRVRRQSGVSVGTDCDGLENIVWFCNRQVNGRDMSSVFVSRRGVADGIADNTVTWLRHKLLTALQTG